jgi:hypothetical protein
MRSGNMKTNIHVKIGDSAYDYVFNMEIDTCKSKWNNQIAGVGYFSEVDDYGDLIIINPANCGVIAITRKY